MMDERGHELEAQVAADPKNVALVHAFALHLVRMGDFLAAQRVVARAIAAGARGKEVIPALLAANVPMRVVPHRAAHALAAVVGRSALPFADLPSPASTRVALAEGILAGLAGDGRRVDVRAIPGGLVPIPGSPFALPGDMLGRAVLVLGNALYAGGEGRSEPAQPVAVRDLQEPRSSWRRVVFPEEACPPDLAVDALLAAPRARVIAVSGAPEPRTCFVIDVRAPLAPRVVETHPLRAHGQEERLLAASLDAKWMALLGAGAVDGAPARWIALHETDGLAERGLLTEPAADADAAWQDLLVVGDRLVVAAGTRGVLSLQLGSATLSPVAEPKLEPGEGAVRLVRLDASRCVASLASAGRPLRHVVVRVG